VRRNAIPKIGFSKSRRRIFPDTKEWLETEKLRPPGLRMIKDYLNEPAMLALL